MKKQYYLLIEAEWGKKKWTRKLDPFITKIIIIIGAGWRVDGSSCCSLSPLTHFPMRLLLNVFVFLLSSFIIYWFQIANAHAHLDYLKSKRNLKHKRKRDGERERKTRQSPIKKKKRKKTYIKIIWSHHNEVRTKRNPNKVLCRAHIFNREPHRFLRPN